MVCYSVVVAAHLTEAIHCSSWTICRDGEVIHPGFISAAVMSTNLEVNDQISELAVLTRPRVPRRDRDKASAGEFSAEDDCRKPEFAEGEQREHAQEARGHTRRCHVVFVGRLFRQVLRFVSSYKISEANFEEEREVSGVCPISFIA